MAQKILNFECMSCGSEGIISYEPQFGEPIFCPFCTEELIDEDDLDTRSLEDDDYDEDDEEDWHNPIDESLMEIDFN